MIIQIKGTSGSGKTTVMREVMGAFLLKPVYAEDWKGKKRRQPLYYATSETDVIVLGHYESTCGGCDNIGSAADVYNLIQMLRKTLCPIRRTILCEGLLLSEDAKWGISLVEQGEDLRAIYLNTERDECIKRLEKRREEANNTTPLNIPKTLKRIETINRTRVRLKNVGAMCPRLTSEKTAKVIIKWIKNNRIEIPF